MIYQIEYTENDFDMVTTFISQETDIEKVIGRFKHYLPTSRRMQIKIVSCKPKYPAEHNPDVCGCRYLGNDCRSCGHIDGEDNPDEPESSIIISVSGGVVQDVSGIPAGLSVHVHDYDIHIDEHNKNEFDVDDNGDQYFLGIWQN